MDGFFEKRSSGAGKNLQKKIVWMTIRSCQHMARDSERSQL